MLKAGTFTVPSTVKLASGVVLRGPVPGRAVPRLSRPAAVRWCASARRRTALATTGGAMRRRRVPSPRTPRRAPPCSSSGAMPRNSRRTISRSSIRLTIRASSWATAPSSGGRRTARQSTRRDRLDRRGQRNRHAELTAALELPERGAVFGAIDKSYRRRREMGRRRGSASSGRRRRLLQRPERRSIDISNAAYCW